MGKIIANDVIVKSDGSISVEPNIGAALELTDDEMALAQEAMKAEVERIEDKYTLVSPITAENIECSVVTEAEALEVYKDFDEIIAFTEIKGGVGLSASQLGIGKQWFIAKMSTGRWEFYCNPKYYPHEKAHVSKREGCLTYPGKFREVKRYKSIIFMFDTLENGKLVNKRYIYRGLDSIVLQHESNHCGYPATIGKNIAITIFKDI